MSASDHLSQVQWNQLPTHPDPHGVSDQDHPAEYVPAGHENLRGTYSLKHVPLEHLHPDHVHTAECYRNTPENVARHDVSPDEEPGEHYDYHYVKQMAEDVDGLPRLVVDRSGYYFGGGHRTAAHAEAGRSTIEAWVHDEARI